VEKAIKNAKPGDVIVLLAKGEEDYQKVRGTFTPFESDLKIAKRMLGIK
jgi:UDP-N-acetylmuramyl tripeptide synthase